MAYDDKSIVACKSKEFALRCIALNKFLKTTHMEFELSKQLIRSGTSIGANVKEALRAQSKADFIAKMNISLKEASETEYWLDLLYAAEYINKQQYDSMTADCKELLRLLTAIIRTSKQNLN